MKTFKILLAAAVAAMMTSCFSKTEASVDVEVTQAGKAVGAGVVVYKFNDEGLGEGKTLYKQNASGSTKTNAAGVAHFDLKSPDDFTPSDVAGLDDEERKVFFFATYDANDERNGMVMVTIKAGDTQTVKLIIDDQPRGGEED